MSNLVVRLTEAFMRLSKGKLSEEEARLKAEEVAPNYDFTKYPMLRHKGLNWYARQILESMKG